MERRLRGILGALGMHLTGLEVVFWQTITIYSIPSVKVKLASQLIEGEDVPAKQMVVTIPVCPLAGVPKKQLRFFLVMILRIAILVNGP